VTTPAPRPEPVLGWATVVAHWQQITAAVVGVVTAIGTACVTIGVVNGGTVQQWVVIAGTVLGALGTLLGVLLPLLGARRTVAGAQVVRAQVTPLESPRNSDGVALVAAPYGRHEAIDGDDHSANMAG
jgi:hypothetical protein